MAGIAPGLGPQPAKSYGQDPCRDMKGWDLSRAGEVMLSPQWHVGNCGDGVTPKSEGVDC